MVLSKELSRIKRHIRVRKKVLGTKDRPRLSVHRSSTNLYVQLIDDIEQKTLFSFSTLDKKFKEICKYGGNKEAAQKLGEMFVSEMKSRGIVKVVFDRGGYLFHGRVKALAEALRKGGIEF